MKKALRPSKKALDEAIHAVGMLPAKLPSGKAIPMLVPQPLLARAQKTLNILQAVSVAWQTIFCDARIHICRKRGFISSGVSQNWIILK
jgi:hypothetical protein